MVRKGADRQVVHELIRTHSQAAAANVKMEGGDNDLIERLKGDPDFASIHDDLDDILDPSAFIGRAPEQVAFFMKEDVEPALERWQGELGRGATLRV
jgi:adenylosuccinate lyase